jgi:hypothetical protein
LPGAKRSVVFDPAERTWIRRELGSHFGGTQDIAQGFLLKTWKSGSGKGQARPGPAVRTMVERGLVEIRPVGLGFRAFFTEAGLDGLRVLLDDRRAMDPAEFGHIRSQLRLPPGTQDASS